MDEGHKLGVAPVSTERGTNSWREQRGIDLTRTILAPFWLFLGSREQRISLSSPGVVYWR